MFNHPKIYKLPESSGKETCVQMFSLGRLCIWLLEVGGPSNLGLEHWTQGDILRRHYNHSCARHPHSSSKNDGYLTLINATYFQNYLTRVMWHLAHRGLYRFLMPDYSHRCRTSTLIMIPINFWWNSDPFKKRTFF